MESEIEGLISEGWKPRIKTKKNRRYITVRKGNKERSFGVYTDDLWEKVKPVNPWATPLQLSLLENRMSNLEKKQGRQTTDFNVVILKRVKQLEETQQESNSSLIMKRIINLEKMRDEILLSARSRQTGNATCKYIDKTGVCNNWFYTCSADRTPEFLRPMKRDEYKGKIVYRINVREHPIFCSACPAYECKSKASRNRLTRRPLPS